MLSKINLNEYELNPQSVSSLINEERSFKQFIKKLKKFTHSSKSRSQTFVYENYQESWGKYLKEQKWKNFDTVTQFCYENYGTKLNICSDKLVLLDNHLYKTTKHNWNKLRIALLYEYVKSFLSNDDVLVELGCGIGRNLFNFYAMGISNLLEGYEYTKTGFQTSEAINNFFQCGIKFGQVDLKKSLKNIDLKNKTVFTHHVLEQLKYDTKDVILNLIEASPKQIIHFEPVVELALDDNFGFIFKKYIEKKDYQDNLLSNLQSLESENKLKIIDTLPNQFGFNPSNQTSIIRWVPK
jgi:hypothetical protein